MMLVMNKERYLTGVSISQTLSTIRRDIADSDHLMADVFLGVTCG
jgi:hypothetical protein